MRRRLLNDISGVVLSRETRTNFFYVVMSSFFKTFAGLITAPIITRILPKEEYGLLGLVATLQGIVIAFSNPGILNALSFSVARGFEGHFRSVTYERFRTYARNGLLLLPVAGWYWLFQGRGDIGLILVMAACTLGWSYGFDTAEQFLVGRSDFASLFWRRLLVVLISSCTSLLVVFLVPMAWPVFLAGQVVTGALNLWVFLLLARRLKNNDFDEAFRERSRGYSVVSYLGSFATYADRATLGAISDLAALAGFGLMQQITSPLEVLTKSINKLFYKKMALPQDRRKYRELAFASFALTVLLSVVLCGIWKIAEPVITWMFPNYPEILTGVPILIVGKILLLGCQPGVLYGQFHAFETWKKFNYFNNIFKVLSTIFAVWFFGISGAVWVYTTNAFISFCFYTILMMSVAEMTEEAKSSVQT